MPAPSGTSVWSRTVPAYWIAHAHVINPAQYKKYTDPIAEIFKSYDGRILARGGSYRVMEGPEEFERHVVIEFPTMEKAVACFECKEYQDAAAFRRNGGGVVEISIVEGV